MKKNTSELLIPFLLILLMIGCEDSTNKLDFEISIIPQPQELNIEDGHFKLDKNTKILVDSDNQEVTKIANYFVKQFNTVSGFALNVSVLSENTVPKNSILFTDKNIKTSLGEEGYTLKSNKNNTVLTGTPHGLFYAVQTLFQLLPAEAYSSKTIQNINWYIPSVSIKDKPRFQWRGMHLDVGRHMFPVSFIKKYIDYIAMHKMNIFHWHLTEDQGWRIEIKKYPRLTEIGAWRKGTQIEKTDEIDNKRYGGYYTQEEIREIVAYAEDRFVTVVPEIELPGHSVAALTAYPELSCTGGPFEVRTKWGISNEIYCAGNDSVFTFLENILSEVLELFPSKYIHIGGDEAPKTRWEECVKCQERIKNEALKDEHELQSYFISRIEKFLNSKGRQIIGWDEILEGGLAPNAAVMSWRGIEGGINAAKQKHNVVMTPSDYLYFDYYEGKPEDEPLAIGGFLPIEKVYAYEPIPEELNIDEQKYIMGVQANQWTEYIATPDLVEYMTLPRLCALSEIAWSPKDKRNLDSFLDRMSTHYERLNELGVNYRWPKLEGFNSKNIFIEKFKVQFISKQKGTKIYYTMDGSTPSNNSTLYTKAFTILKTTDINIIEYSSKGKSSPVYKLQYIKQKPIEAVSTKSSQKGLMFEFFKFEKPINSTTKLLDMKASFNGNVKSFIIPVENDKLPEKFGLIYKGFITIPADGVYTFSILSNDGSKLYIADQLVVDNDGLHSAYEKDGEIALKAGQHKIQLNYFQAGGGKALNVYLKSEKSEKTEVSENILTY